MYEYNDHCCQVKDETDKSSVCLFDDCENTYGEMLFALEEFYCAIPYDLRP